MEPFEIKNLFYISGKTGLFRIKLRLRNGMLVFTGLLDDKDITIDPKKSSISKFEDTAVYKLDGSTVTLESIIEKMYELKLSGTIFDNFETIDAKDKANLMELTVPGYDGDKFKSFHMGKIVKWFVDIDKALSILNDGITDPYAVTEKIEDTNEENEEKNI